MSKRYSNPVKAEIESADPREIPDSVKKKTALAYNQNQMSIERTNLSKYRTDLAFINSKLAVEQTHLSYLRTIVTLIGTGATIFKALPIIGISRAFSYGLSLFLFLCSAYFIYKDWSTYPSTKRHIEELEKEASDSTKDIESLIFAIDNHTDK